MARDMRTMLVVAAALAGVLMLGACTAGGADPAELKGAWRVESFGGVKGLVEGDAAVLTLIEFADGKATGNGGVNSFGAAYDASPGRLKFGPVTHTEMAGSLGAMTQEKQFFEALERTRGFELNEGKLILTSSNNDTLVVLAPK